MSLSDDDVREILRLIDEEGPAEVRVETAGLRIHVVRGEGAASSPSPAPPELGRSQVPDRDLGAPKPRRATGTVAIEAPMLGIFYVAEGPGKPPFVAVGDRVEPDTVVGIVEVMKMMNSVEAGVSGTVVEVCVANADLVEEGQPLLLVDPA